MSCADLSGMLYCEMVQSRHSVSALVYFPLYIAWSWAIWLRFPSSLQTLPWRKSVVKNHLCIENVHVISTCLLLDLWTNSVLCEPANYKHKRAKTDTSRFSTYACGINKRKNELGSAFKLEAGNSPVSVTTLCPAQCQGPVHKKLNRHFLVECVEWEWMMFIGCQMDNWIMNEYVKHVVLFTKFCLTFLQLHEP